MSKKFRDYLFLMFIIVFVVSTVLMSLYASGYKFNLSWPLKFNRLLVKTGMLTLSTKPDGAVVYLDSEAQTGATLIAWKKKPLTTPVKIKNILPGDYDLTLQREGYQPFHKKISIFSGQTTFLEDINLFRADEPALVITTPEGTLSLSPSRRYLYAAAAQKIINLKNNEEGQLAAVSNSASSSWLNTGDRLFTEGVISAPDGRQEKDYRQILGTGTESWYYDEGNSRLYYKNKGALSYLDTNKNISTAIAGAEDCLAYEPRGDNLFFVSRQNDLVSLHAYSLKTGETWQQAELPTVGDYRFSIEGRQALELYDAKNGTLYLFDAANIAAAPRTLRNVSGWKWLDDNTLLYNNAWEIYSLNIQQGNPNLLTRVGEEITDIIWNSNKGYLTFATGRSLNALDLKTLTITSLLGAEKIASPVLDEKNSVLYFWAKTNGQEGIYKLLLQ